MIVSCEIRNMKHKKDAIANNPEVKIMDSTAVQIIDSSYNFGTVVDGEKVQFSFRFKNVGNHPLVIRSAQASCGCTVAEKPDQPIAPGEIGYIKAVFNSAGRIGEAHKDIRVISNANPKFPLLTLTGEVTAGKGNP